MLHRSDQRTDPPRHELRRRSWILVEVASPVFKGVVALVHPHVDLAVRSVEFGSGRSVGKRVVIRSIRDGIPNRFPKGIGIDERLAAGFLRELLHVEVIVCQLIQERLVLLLQLLAERRRVNQPDLLAQTRTRFAVSARPRCRRHAVHQVGILDVCFRQVAGRGHQTTRIHRIQGHPRDRQQLQHVLRLFTQIRHLILVRPGARLWVERHRSCKPDEILASRHRRQVIGQLIQSVDGHLAPQLHFEQLRIIDKLLHRLLCQRRRSSATRNVDRVAQRLVEGGIHDR